MIDDDPLSAPRLALVNINVNINFIYRVQEISDATITQEGGVTTLTFVRPLEPIGDGKKVRCCCCCCCFVVAVVAVGVSLGVCTKTPRLDLCWPSSATKASIRACLSVHVAV